MGLANALPSVAVVIYAGGTLTLSSVNDTISTLTMYNGGTSGAAIATGTGVLTISNTGSVTLNLSGVGTVGSTISGNLAMSATTTFTIADGTATDDLAVSAVVSRSIYGYQSR